MNDISIDFSKNVGTIRPLHGVNNGPLTYGFVLNTSQYFKEAGIPYSRLHDTEYPYGSGILWMFLAFSRISTEILPIPPATISR